METKPELVRILNERFNKILCVSGISILPFRNTDSEMHANMTGELRIRIAQFLWVSFMGLQLYADPYTDMLLKSALAIDKLWIYYRGINQSKTAAVRTEDDIEVLPSTAFDAGLCMTQAMTLSVNINFHRLIRLVSDLLISFGWSHYGNKDQNEMLHKRTKMCVSSTNHWYLQIGLQILSLRTISMYSSAEDRNDSGINKLEGFEYVNDFQDSDTVPGIVTTTPYQIFEGT